MSQLSFIVPTAMLILFYLVSLYLTYHTLARRVSKIIKDIQRDDFTLFSNSMIYFKNFNVPKQVLFGADFKPMYIFYKADIFIKGDNLIIFGKARKWLGLIGKEITLMPFVICWGNCDTPIGFKTSAIKTTLNGKNLEIEFFDAAFPHIITLGIRKIGMDIYDKLQQNHT